MKKALIVLGSIVLAIVLAVGTLRGYGFYKASGLNASSKTYVEANVPPIVREWSRQELAKHASPSLVKVMHAKPEKSRRVWKLLVSNLGPMQSFLLRTIPFRWAVCPGARRQERLCGVVAFRAPPSPLWRNDPSLV